MSANQQLSDKNFQIEQVLSERNQVLTHLNQELAEAANYVIGGMPDASYEKNRLILGEKTKLYIFSDGVYEVEK